MSLQCSSWTGLFPYDHICKLPPLVELFRNNSGLTFIQSAPSSFDTSRRHHIYTNRCWPVPYCVTCKFNRRDDCRNIRHRELAADNPIYLRPCTSPLPNLLGRSRREFKNVQLWYEICRIEHYLEDRRIDVWHWPFATLRQVKYSLLYIYLLDQLLGTHCGTRRCDTVSESSFHPTLRIVK